MYHSDIIIKEGAYFISDAHYSSLRPKFLDFLHTIQNKQLLPTQLIFMGDIFDTLFDGVKKTLQINAEAISIINTLSEELEVIYLEGNHDFNLKDIFPKVKVFPIEQQPVVCLYEEETMILAHGDFDAPFGYQVYTSVIRNKNILKFLSFFDTFILKKLDRYLALKDDCKELDWFEGFTKNRIEGKYTTKYFIEGHFHQNKVYTFAQTKYINLGAFACNQRYFIVKSSKYKELLEEKQFL